MIRRVLQRAGQPAGGELSDSAGLSIRRLVDPLGPAGGRSIKSSYRVHQSRPQGAFRQCAPPHQRPRCPLAADCSRVAVRTQYTVDLRRRRHPIITDTGYCAKILSLYQVCHIM